jgi:hypothetical protein
MPQGLAGFDYRFGLWNILQIIMWKVRSAGWLNRTHLETRTRACQIVLGPYKLMDSDPAGAGAEPTSGAQQGADFPVMWNVM